MQNISFYIIIVFINDPFSKENVVKRETNSVSGRRKARQSSIRRDQKLQEVKARR